MDKLELDLNDLEVDSFRADPKRSEAEGTVHGNDPEGPFPPPDTFYDGETCGLSCGGTCGDQTCANGCDPDLTGECNTGDVICPV